MEKMINEPNVEIYQPQTLINYWIISSNKPHD